MPNDDTSKDPYCPAAQAMDRVLDTERAAQAAIRECEQQASAMIARARQERQRILERAQARVATLHARAAEILERQTRDLSPRPQDSEGESPLEHRSDSVRLRRALEKLAERLTTDQDERAHNVR